MSASTDIKAKWTLGSKVWTYTQGEYEADISMLPPESLPPPDPVMNTLLITNPFNYFTAKNYYAISAFNGKLNLGSTPITAVLKFEWFNPGIPVPAEDEEEEEEDEKDDICR